MEIPIVITIIITFFSPYVNAYIQKVTWSSETKNLLAITVSLIIAVVYLIVTGGIADWSQIGIAIPAVYGLQQATYNFILKNSATKFEAITRTKPVIVAPSDANPGMVTVTTEETIKNSEHIEIEPPLRITNDEVVDEIKTTTPHKG